MTIPHFVALFGPQIFGPFGAVPVAFLNACRFVLTALKMATMRVTILIFSKVKPVVLVIVAIHRLCANQVINTNNYYL